jgi:hypothetical protein
VPVASGRPEAGEYRYIGGQLQHARKPPALRGLNVNHNHDLKNLFKSAATQAGACKNDPLGEFYQNLLATGMEPPMRATNFRYRG